MKKEFNTLFGVVLCLVIARHAIAMITSIPNIYYATQGYISLGGAIWNLVMNIAMIVILLFVLKIKRWALYAFGGLQIINVVVLSIFQGDLLVHLIVALVMCAIMAGLLCLRNTGVSGWKIFFAPESEFVNESEVVPSEKVSEDKME